MTELATTPQRLDDALPLGPQSLVWRYFGDNRMFLIGPRPAVLQNMLAELGQGVLDHSVFFDDTAARVKRSLPPIFMTVYGSDDDNPGQQVRDFHTEIKGTMPRRRARYHALDPETYFWAHATFVDQVLYFADTFVKRLSRRGEGTDLPRIQDVVPPLRRQRAGDARRLRRVRAVLGPDDRRDRRRPPDRQVRRRLCHQGLPVPEGRPAGAVAGDLVGVQPGRGVPDHRRYAAAHP